jgi:hypothetical protein
VSSPFDSPNGMSGLSKKRTLRSSSEPKMLSSPKELSEPLKWRKPLNSSEPFRLSNPSEGSEPHSSSNPLMLSEPSGSSNPLQQSEPCPPSSPNRLSEPSDLRKPQDSSEPFSASNPYEMSEPRQSSNPTERSEPHSASNPSLLSEPKIQSNPSKPSEPSEKSKPGGMSEPDTTSNPKKASEPPSFPPGGGGGASSDFDAFGRQLAYLAVGGYYDHQKLRAAHMNRVRDLIRKVNENIPLDKVEEKKEVKKFDKKYKDENLHNILRGLRESGKISQEEVNHIIQLLAISDEEHELEARYKKIIQEWASGYKVYEWLDSIRGIGSVLGGGLLATFDVRKTKHISSFWAYAGLGVVDGHAPKRTRGEKLNYSTQARTLCWKVADSFIKQRTHIYRDIYDITKAEETAKLKDSGEKGWKQHADLRARRKMVKAFLADFWVAWRKSEGLPVDPPYSARFHP